MIEGIVNIRELGGIPTRDGRVVAHGLVYRSGHLGGLVAEGGEAEPVDFEGFRSAGIREVFDLRTRAEVTRSPDRVPPEVTVRHLDVLAGTTESIAAHLEEIFADPTNAQRVLEGGVIDRHYRQTYRNLVRLDSARSSYAEMFSTMVAVEHPVLFHCTAGKDRTGWAAASLLTLLGVDRATVLENYLASNEPVLDAFAPLFAQFADMGGDPTLLEPAFFVLPTYLDAAFEALEEDYGTVEDYFERGLGVSRADQKLLRDRLLTESPGPA